MNKKVILLMALLLSICGCKMLSDASQEVGETGYQMHKDLDEAFDTFGRDYLKSNKWFRERLKEIEVIAYEHLMTTEYKDIYDPYTPAIDQEEMMPEANPFYFVHFRLKEDEPEVTEDGEVLEPEAKEEKPQTDEAEEEEDRTTYLVVVKAGTDKVVYSGVFEKPKGDWFYRYREILKEIK